MMAVAPWYESRGKIIAHYRDGTRAQLPLLGTMFLTWMFACTQDCSTW